MAASGVAAQLPSPPAAVPAAKAATPPERSGAGVVVRDGVRSLVGFVRDINERVTLRTRPDVWLKLRKRAPLMAVEILVGTDIHLMSAADGFMLRAYVPNLQVEAKDAFLGGDIRVHSKEQELSYTKRLDINGVTVGLSGVYNFATRTPYAGFSVEATPGVSSSYGSNGLSINHSFRKAFLDEVLRTRVDVVGSVALPPTRFNSATRKLGLQGPIAVDLRDVTIMAIL